MKKHSHIHPDLLEAQHLAYEPSGFSCIKLIQEAESQKYGACTFEINGKIIKYRSAKITPTKIGQFVTLWKRSGSGPIIPYDITDPVDLFVVSARNTEHFGQFIFSKDILFEKGFVSKDGIGGKLAMRVYTPWDITDSRQAKQTQAWQLLYFVEIQPTINTANIKKLFAN